MNTNYPTGALLQSFVKEAKTELVSLSAIEWQVRQDMPELPEEHVRAATLDIIGGMLGAEGLVVGEFVDDGTDTLQFAIWREVGEEALGRVAREFERLDWRLNPGNVGWIGSRDLLPVQASRSPMRK